MPTETTSHECRDPPLVKTPSYDSTWQLSRVHVRTETALTDSDCDDAEPATRLAHTETTLANAAAAGDAVLVRKLIAAGVNLNAPPARVRGRNALQAACGSGKLEVVEILLEEGASINAPPSDWYGRTPLAAAAAKGHIEVVRRLVQAGANISALPADQYGRTAVQSAAEAGHEEVLKLLLDTGASPDEPACPFGGRTALAAAAGAGHEEICRILLACEANPDAPASASRGVMALHAAASGGLSKIVQRLLLAGADVNAPNTGDQRTALHTAAQYGQTMVARLLHRHGAQPGLRDVNGRQALHVAAQYGRLEFVKWLLSLRPEVDIDCQDYNGATPLHLAAEYEPVAVEALLEAGASTEIADHRNYRPLHIAFEACSSDSIYHLLRKGADTTDFPICKWRDVLKAQPEDVIVFTELATEFKKVGRVKDAVRGLDDWDSPIRKYYSAHAVKSSTVQDSVINPRSYMPHSKYFNNTSQNSSKFKRATVDWLWSPIIPDPNPQPRQGQWATIGRDYGMVVYNNPPSPKTPVGGNAVISLIPGLPNLSNIAVSPRKVVLICHVSFDMVFPSEEKYSLVEDELYEESGKSYLYDYEKELVGTVEETEPNEDIATETFRTRADKSQISWVMTGPRSNKDIDSVSVRHSVALDKPDGILQSVEYRSAMPDCGWIPKHSVEFLTLFIVDLHKKWKKLFWAAEEHLSSTRERLLLNKGKSKDLIEHLLKDAQKWADFRVLLQIHVRKACSLVEEYKRHTFLYEEVLLCEDESDPTHGAALQRLSDSIAALDLEGRTSITRLDEKTKEMIGLEFSLVSIYEAQRSTIMTVSMKRLSWITFIFLPMMFVSSLFGMNVNALSQDPDWQWYLLISVGVMFVVTLVWLLFKYIKLEAWLEKKVDSLVEQMFSCFSRCVERRRRGKKQKKKPKGDLENVLCVGEVPVLPLPFDEQVPREWKTDWLDKAKNT